MSGRWAGQRMGKGRLEAFSDGVLAIVITIMVLDLKVPRGDTPDALAPLVPSFLGYALSFLYVGIYWNNHHHMFQICRRISGAVLWANLHLLFWLSLLPFAAGWMGAHPLAAAPSALYGGVLLGAALAYWILQGTIISAEGPDSLLRRAVGRDRKGKISLLSYVVGIGFSLGAPILAQVIYTIVALAWVIPDRRIECLDDVDDDNPTATAGVSVTVRPAAGAPRGPGG